VTGAGCRAWLRTTWNARVRIRGMEDTERHVRADVAGLAAVIERASADLALSEEPANLVAALEAGAPDGTPA
jgi:hypothetical protein